MQGRTLYRSGMHLHASEKNAQKRDFVFMEQEILNMHLDQETNFDRAFGLFYHHEKVARMFGSSDKLQKQDRVAILKL